MRAQVHLDNVLQAARSGGHAEEDESREQGETADRGHEQRLGGLPARALLLVIPADEEEGEDGGGFPKDEEQEEVVGEDDPDHGGSEGEQGREETWQARGVAVVQGRVVKNRGGSPADHGEKEGAKGVEDKGEVNAECGDPGEAEFVGSARG